MLLSVLIMITGCQNLEDEASELQGMTDLSTAFFARDMRFGFYPYIEFSFLHVDIMNDTNIYSFVFVTDFEEIIDPPYDKMFFFPTELTLGVIEGLNELIVENDFDLSDFSFSYPLTVDDLIDNREEVNRWWRNRLGRGQRDRVSRYRVDRNSEIYQARWLEELNLPEEYARLRQLLLFGQSLHFEHNMDLRFKDMRLEIESGTHRFTDVAFVHSSEEALGVADGVIALWPTDDSLIAVEYFNSIINRYPVIVFEDLGLSYPVTIEDVVDRWECVLALWQSVSATVRVETFTRPMWK